MSQLPDPSKPTIVVAFNIDPSGLQVFTEAVGGAAEVITLPKTPAEERAAILSRATVIFSRNPDYDIHDAELELITDAMLLQSFSAGIDFIHLDRIPPSVPIACNAGAFAEPMAEHAVAMTLAAFKRLFVEHRNLEQGEFNQFIRNKSVAGTTFGIYGFGGIGIATARLMQALGCKVMAINRRGVTDEPVDFIGTPKDLDAVLKACDALLLSAPYTSETEHVIGARELGLMKPDATLVNLARGELIDEAALYTHLKANPEFTACIDAWWIEPVRHGEFRMDYPFLDLANVIASPHNSASVDRTGSPPHQLAGENCRRAVSKEAPWHVVERALSPLAAKD